MGRNKFFSNLSSYLKGLIPFWVFVLLFFLQCSLLKLDYLEDDSNKGGYNPLCLLSAHQATLCPDCKLNIEVDAVSYLLHSNVSMQHPNYNQSGVISPFPQSWSSNSSEHVYIEIPNDTGAMVLSQGLVFEFTDSSSNVYENFDDTFQLEQAYTDGDPESLNGPLAGNVSGPLRNKSNFSETVNLTGTIRNYNYIFDSVNCTNGF